jgi:hypothetical protein
MNESQGFTPGDREEGRLQQHLIQVPNTYSLQKYEDFFQGVPVFELKYSSIRPFSNVWLNRQPRTSFIRLHC